MALPTCDLTRLQRLEGQLVVTSASTIHLRPLARARGNGGRWAATGPLVRDKMNSQESGESGEERWWSPSEVGACSFKENETRTCADVRCLLLLLFKQ